MGYEPDGDFLLQLARPYRSIIGIPAADDLIRAALLCNDADAAHQRTTTGSSMATRWKAALVIARHEGRARPGVRSGDSGHDSDEIPFESEHRFMATLHHDHDGAGLRHVKGAPERVA